MADFSWQRLVDIASQTWPARLAQGLYDAAKLPGDVYAGRITPNDPDYYRRAFDLASGLIGSGTPFAEAGALGMSGGRRLGKSDYDLLLNKQRISDARAAVKTGPETIKLAAVMDQRGNVYEAAVHNSARQLARTANKSIEPDSILADGFTTSKGRFVSREEAARIAENSGQVPKGYTQGGAGWLDAADYYAHDVGPWWADGKPAVVDSQQTWLSSLIKRAK